MAAVRKGKAFAPAHITGFFQIFPNGSTGAGLNPEHGVTTSVEVSKGSVAGTSIQINGELVDAKVSQKVIEGFKELLADCSLTVSHKIDFPIGYGMGMSAAGAFSLSLALNQATGESKSYNECMEIARQSDIFCGTGLGDVVAQQFPGVMMGLPPYPSMSVKQIPCDDRYVVSAFFQPIETARIIRDAKWKEKINNVGGRCMEELSSECTLSNFIRLSREFTLETELASPDVKRVMTELPECSMAMLGQTAFWICKDPQKAKSELSKFSDRITISPLAEQGARTL